MFSIVFFGSSKYSVDVLKALIKDGRYDVKLVVTQPDAPVGRGQELTPTAVSQFVGAEPQRGPFSGRAVPANVETAVFPGCARTAPTEIKPATLKDPLTLKEIAGVNPTLGVMLDYGLLIPKEIIELFPKGIINLHPSLLPKHKGAIPAVSTILDGDINTGVTIIKIDEKFDSGNIIAQEESDVLQDDIPPVLYDRLFKIGVNLLLRVLPGYLEGTITPKPQLQDTLPLEKRLTKASGRIDWSKNDQYLERFVRAMTPWPGAWTTLSDLSSSFTNLSSSEKITPRNFYPGTHPQKPDGRIVKILKSHLDPEGHLKIDQLQIEGKKPITWQQFRAGYLE